MPQAAPTSTTLVGRNNVIALQVPPDTFITPFMLEQAHREVAARLPAGLFEVFLIQEEDFGIRQDHVHLERVGVLPVGHYQIWREGCAGFSVSVIGEPDDGVEVFTIGPFRVMSDAVQAVIDSVNEQMAAWGLPSTGAEAA